MKRKQPRYESRARDRRAWGCVPALQGGAQTAAAHSDTSCEYGGGVMTHRIVPNTATSTCLPG